MRFTTALLAAPLLLAASIASAQTPVTAIDGSQGWGPYNRFGTTDVVVGSQTIDGTYQRGVNGSIHIGGPAGTTGLRNRISLLNASPTGFGLVSNLTSTGFDWLRSSTSTTAGIQAPAFRLFVNNAGSLSEFIWEYVYNGAGNAPVDAWQSVSLGLSSGNFWNFGTGGYQNTTCGRGTGSQLTTTLQGFMNAGCLTAGAYVYGISVGLGALPDNGSFDGAVDLPRLGFGQQSVQSWDFQTAQSTTAPEPSTYALMAAGLAALGMVARRRRANA